MKLRRLGKFGTQNWHASYFTEDNGGSKTKLKDVDNTFRISWEMMNERQYIYVTLLTMRVSSSKAPYIAYIRAEHVSCLKEENNQLHKTNKFH